VSDLVKRLRQLELRITMGANETCGQAATRIEVLEAALRAVVAWDMPETGKYWPNDDGTQSDHPMSYGAAYGSNGERDYIRALARNALGRE